MKQKTTNFNKNVRKVSQKKRHMIEDGLAKKCISLDLYGRNVQLTYNGHEKFRTKFGAFCTLLVFIIVMVYALYSLADLLSPQPILPLHSKISYRSFYAINEGIDSVRERDGSLSGIGASDQGVRPMKFFAFGLGHELVSESVGEFKVTAAT